MKYIIALIIAAVIATYPKSTDAFGVSTTRKTFLSQVVTVPALICTTTTTMIVALPNNASAADGVLQNAEKKAAEKKARRDKAAAVAAREKASNDEDTATNKAGSNESFRGGKTAADKIIYGTELNERQTEETNGLMGKLGL
mmetsp:Transcript_26633/g.30675  ORF Transcript_26633/g.30675 Transcript_26633/m.30675 type:complete len:142 (+) Transcript_26633:58-483(+)